ncbi:MAG: helicase associated domain-containing protein, partial [Verrucomicrobiota bacterium]
LKQFHAEHGHCRVPAGWTRNPVLANWVGVQRARKIDGKLSAARTSALDALGFTWRLGEFSGTRSPQEAWTVMYKQLAECAAKTGTANIPQIYPPNQKLGWWVSTQRRNRRRNRLTTDQIALLDALNLDWQPLQGGKKELGADSSRASISGEHAFRKLWQQRFDELSRYQAEHGNCRVPSGWSQNPQLANWVGVQRLRYKQAKLSVDRIQQLEAIGFDWVVGQNSNTHFGWNTDEAVEQRWKLMFDRLRAYKTQYGNCLVPQTWKEDRGLAKWVSCQRAAYSRDRLTPERVRLLDEIGFDWEPVASRWEEMFLQLVKFKNEHGHTNVPQRSPKYSELATWVHNQRAAKQNNRPIIAIRGKRLDEIGFAWRLVEHDAWEIMLERLVDFKKVHGHCNVPQKGGGDKRLGRWVNTQRTHFKRGDIKPDRIRQLEEIGFVWNTQALPAASEPVPSSY